MKIEEYESLEKLAKVMEIFYKNTDCFKMAEEQVDCLIVRAKSVAIDVDIETCVSKLIRKYNEIINEQVAIESVTWSRK